MKWLGASNCPYLEGMDIEQGKYGGCGTGGKHESEVSGGEVTVKHDQVCCKGQIEDGEERDRREESGQESYKSSS